MIRIWTHILCGLTTLVVIFAALWVWLYPNLNALSQHRIEPNEIRVLSAPYNNVIRRPNVTDPDIRLSNQNLVDDKHGRQFNYKLTDVQSTDIAVFIPNANTSLELHLNGVHQGSSTQTGNLNFELFKVVNPNGFHPGLNRIQILSAPSPHKSNVSEIYTGDAKTLKSIKSRLSRHIKTIKTLTVLGLTIGFIASTIGLVISDNKRVFTGVLLFSTLTLGQTLNLPHQDAIIWPLIAKLGLLTSLCLYSLNLWNENSKYLSLHFGVILAAIFGLTGSFLLTPSGFIDNKTQISILSTALTLPLMLFAWPALLASKIFTFRRALVVAQQDSRLKDQLILEKTKELEKERETKILNEERQRFTRDIHDGIGGQLLSLLVRLRSGTIDMNGVQNEIKSGLNDLRLVVDSLDHVGDNLETALATFRQRAQVQCSAENIQLTWEQSIRMDDQTNDVRQILHIYRILQECISNILRHAEASHIDVSIIEDPLTQELKLTIQDNGKGMDLTKTYAGKGLLNIKNRVKKLKGTALISNCENQPGLRVYVEIPMIKSLS